VGLILDLPLGAANNQIYAIALDGKKIVVGTL
jgi:hypothetical protein